MPKPRVLLVPMLVAAWACVLPAARSFAAAGCTPGGTPAPPGAGMRLGVPPACGGVGDLDGDGGPDTLWVRQFRDGNGRTDRVVGVTTASGANSDVQVLSASPMPLVALAIDAQNDGGNQIIVSNGRSARLYVFADCRLQSVVDNQGTPFYLHQLTAVPERLAP